MSVLKGKGEILKNPNLKKNDRVIHELTELHKNERYI